MANHSASKKSIRKTATRTAINRNRKSRIKTFIRSLEALIGENKKEEARAYLQKEVQSEIMRGVTKGVFKKNKGSRLVSRLNDRVKALFA